MLREPCATHILIGRLDFARLDVLPAHEVHGIVEEQVALGLALADQQYGILVRLMLTGEPAVIDIVEDIDIMDEDGLLVAEEVLGVFQSPTRLEQLARLVAEMHQRSIVLLRHIVADLLGEVVDVDDETVVALGLQLTDVPFQQGLATHWNERFGHGVRQRFQSCAKACSQNHCLFHFASNICVMFCSRWQMRTSMPKRSWICSAKCWAE